MFGLKKRKILSLLIIDAKCTGCGMCIDRCRKNVIDIAEENGHRWAWAVRPDECTGCGRCQKNCPEDAIRIMTKKIVE
ncbi:ATP-binding protein [Bacteroides sp.]|uniref:ATP-binding protein n=1 Tax=Bacteroides sp. TaxID=29523 RepID=UPI00345DC8F9